VTTPQSENITRVFAYLRVSSRMQMDGDGYDRQLAACERYVAVNSMEIAEVFRESITGTSDLEGRPAFGELLIALEENGVKTVIVERLDRLARDLMVQENIIQDMQRNGYTLISCYEPDLCSTDPSRVLMRQIFGAIAQYDKSTTVLKLAAAKERIRKHGRRPGTRGYSENPAQNKRTDGQWPYGSKLGEQAVLIKMRGWRDAGMKLVDITAALNTEQIPARKGKPWTLGTVGRILSR
jgi:DNA invertase Pin-like site-specific DNA recombinase